MKLGPCLKERGALSVEEHGEVARRVRLPTPERVERGACGCGALGSAADGRVRPRHLELVVVAGQHMRGVQPQGVPTQAGTYIGR